MCHISSYDRINLLVNFVFAFTAHLLVLPKPRQTSVVKHQRAHYAQLNGLLNNGHRLVRNGLPENWILAVQCLAFILNILRVLGEEKAVQFAE